MLDWIAAGEAIAIALALAVAYVKLRMWEDD